MQTPGVNTLKFYFWLISASINVLVKLDGISVNLIQILTC